MIFIILFCKIDNILYEIDNILCFHLPGDEGDNFYVIDLGEVDVSNFVRPLWTHIIPHLSREGGEGLGGGGWIGSWGSLTMRAVGSFF